MTEFQSYVLIAATLVSVVSFVMFIVSWNRRNARLEAKRREDALAQAEAITRERARRETTYRRETGSGFADRLAESRSGAESLPTAPAPISLSKDRPTPTPEPSHVKRTPPRKRSGGGRGRGRRSGGSSSSGYYGGASCSTSGSSCSSGGSSCGGGGGSSCGGGGSD
jgi:uncharacterized membrane protein YgcG